VKWISCLSGGAILGLVEPPVYTIYGTPPRRSARLKVIFWQDFALETFLFEKTRFYLIAKQQNFLSTYRSVVLFTKQYRTKHVLPLLCALFFNVSTKKVTHLLL
jgi:hypothetical protein